MANRLQAELAALHADITTLYRSADDNARDMRDRVADIYGTRHFARSTIVIFPGYRQQEPGIESAQTRSERLK